MKQYQKNTHGPLGGIRVIDMSRLIAGNMLSLQLGDFGAEVIKIETPGKGDDLRSWKTDGVEAFWKVYCRNKKSLSLNLRNDDAKTVFNKLVPTAHVLIENFRPGTLEKMGYGPDVLHTLCPKLIIIRISGWGQDGPYRHKPGFGTLVEAMTGFAAMNGYGDRPPVLPPLAMADMIAGITGAFAATVALREAERDGGKGQVIDLPLFDPMLGILGPQAADFKVTGGVTQREGSAWQRSAPRNVYETSAGGYVSLSASMQGMCEQLFKAMGREELIHDMRFLTNSDRVRNRDELDAIIQNWMRQRPRDEVLGYFDKLGITVGPVSDIAELVDHPFIKGRGIIEEYPDEEMDGVPMHAVTPRLSQTPGAVRSPAPKLGEHNSELLEELGYSAKAQAKLKKDGAI